VKTSQIEVKKYNRTKSIHF